MEIKGKRILVTGGSQGLGEVLCRRLAALGAQIYVNCAHNRAAAEKIAGEIHGEDCVFDITDESAVRAFFASHEVDVLINNARQDPYKRNPEYSDSQWFDRIVGVNLKGPYLCSFAALEQFEKRKFAGKIIQVSSVWAYRAAGRPMLEYAMTKAALHSLNRSLAGIAAASGVTVNAVAPGMILSKELRERLTPEQESVVLKRIPLGRGAAPAEIVDAVEFLIGNDYVTGEILNINGGAGYAL